VTPETVVEHRMRLPAGTPLAPLDALGAGVTAGLAEHLDEVQAIDALAERDAVRLLHAAVDADGVPLTVDSVVSTKDGDVRCLLFPTTGAPQPLVVEVDLSGAVTGRVERYGPHARADLPGLNAPVDLPAAALPGWLFALAGLGPRPVPRFQGVMLSAGDDLPVRGRRIRLDWSAGMITAPDLTATGRIDVIDAHQDGLWLVYPPPPELVDDDVPPDAVALRPVRPGDLWNDLVLLLA
jgi:hypothetical protein